MALSGGLVGLGWNSCATPQAKQMAWSDHYPQEGGKLHLLLVRSSLHLHQVQVVLLEHQCVTWWVRVSGNL